MLTRRVIPVLFLKDGWMVRSEYFRYHQYIGDPVIHVQRMVQWNVDELVVIDIRQGKSSTEHHRIDYRNKPVSNVLDLVRLISVDCNMPLSIGGGIRTIEQIADRIRNGADKVVVCSLLADDPNAVRRAAHAFGSQALVACVDYRMIDGKPIAFVNNGATSTLHTALEWASKAVELGAGEILLHAIERDGSADGYDVEVIGAVASELEVPVIACGGAASNSDFLAVLASTQVSAIAAGNMFHFKENAYPLAKQYLRQHLPDIR